VTAAQAPLLLPLLLPPLLLLPELPPMLLTVLPCTRATRAMLRAMGTRQGSSAA
jgi:hypothetical protein